MPISCFPLRRTAGLPPRARILAFSLVLPVLTPTPASVHNPEGVNREGGR